MGGGISQEVGGSAIIRLLGSTRRGRRRGRGGDSRGGGVSVGFESVRDRALGEGERWWERPGT